MYGEGASYFEIKNLKWQLIRYKFKNLFIYIQDYLIITYEFIIVNFNFCIFLKYFFIFLSCYLKVYVELCCPLGHGNGIKFVIDNET